MKTPQSRPVNLDLRTLHFPLTALVSISHRISGVVTFFGLGCLLLLLKISLFSYEGFEAVKNLLTNPIARFFLWGFLSLFGFHIMAGIRHFFMDFGYFEELDSATASSKIAFVLAVIFSFIMGWWLW